MDAYSTYQAQQAPYTVRALSLISHRITLEHLFPAPSHGNTFHENADQFSDDNHADNASLTRTILVASWKRSSYTSYSRNSVNSSEDF